ncbi:Cytosine/adenosine deaminase [Alteromonadaceae bacterium Bs31]|nr:Cytosine/adenosine deaminase [Alteromonadaceae bacterium Bs31]
MNQAIPIDLSLDASWILPVAPRGKIFNDCSLLIKGSEIVAIQPWGEVDEHYCVKKHIDLSGKLLMPGLINCHGHAAMTLLRGYADDLALDTWLNEHIWPAESRWVNEEFVEDGTRLAIAEMQLSGTTCFSDMYFFPEIAASTAHDCGMRTQIVFPVFDFPNNWSKDADDGFHKGLTLRDTYRSQELISVGFGPHAPYTVNDDVLQRIATYAEELQAPVQIHLHESADEIEKSMQQFGMRPIQRLQELGLLSPLTQCVHMTQVDAAIDIPLLKENGAHVIHCPQSNMKLASGHCPVQQILAEEINIALGTDGAASNNDLDLFCELQTAALLAKFTSNDPAALQAMSALEMATINGAKAIGQEDRLGSLEPGKQADIIAIDLSNIASQPVYSPVSQLVYTASGSRVSHSWIAGHAVVDNGKLCRIQEQELLTAASKWQARLK